MELRSAASAVGAHRASRGIAVRTTAEEPQVRAGLRPGDIGAIAEQHGRLYAREFGLDTSFEADLARALYAAAEGGWPQPHEGLWVVERAGRLGGSLVLTDEGEGSGRIRAFLLDPSLRGRGLGRRLLGELIDHARGVGYERLVLNTFSELRQAARLYLDHGFELVAAETGPRWGMERMTFQRYERPFQRRAQARRS